ncbi:MAG: branched-chain amino acid ABC transporter substrate-binding protein [Chloroflexi bacterium]|nr:branched-chain amino acid ABC transporter substrate-binding protein [Chloroflexota bacterium]MDL1883263.1 branched-chain amino acid ABC transporter substrate-binding protein [Anaerolineae bacterium CFX8]
MQFKRLVFLFVIVVLALSVPLVGAQDAKVIKIASQSPLSGPQSILGTSIRNAAELAIEQLSGPLVEMGYSVEFVPFDDQATPDVGVANANLLVNDAAIMAVIGHLNSGVAIPSSEVYNDNGLAMVSPANTNVAITDRGLPVVNRICGRDDTQGAAGAAFAATLEGVETVYVLHDTTAYGQGVADFFQKAAAEQGLTVLGFEGTTETANFEGVIQPILALDPDLIYFGGIYSQTGIFINQARAAGYEGLYMGPDGFDASEFAELAGEAGVNTYYTSVAAPPTFYPAAAQFIEDYTAKFGEPPQPFAAQSYDSTGIVLAAIQRILESGEALTREAVAAEVRATENYEGITGTYTFDDNGDPELATYVILQVVSSDPAEWNSNVVLDQFLAPSPLVAAAEAEAEATPSS